MSPRPYPVAHPRPFRCSYLRPYLILHPRPTLGPTNGPILCCTLDHTLGSILSHTLGPTQCHTLSRTQGQTPCRILGHTLGPTFYRTLRWLLGPSLGHPLCFSRLHTFDTTLSRTHGCILHPFPSYHNKSNKISIIFCLWHHRLQVSFIYLATGDLTQKNESCLCGKKSCTVESTSVKLSH